MNNNDRKSSQFSTSSYRQTDNGLHHNNKSNSNSNSNNYNDSNHMTKTNSLNPSIWTTNTSRSSSKSNFTSGSNDFHFIQTSDLNTTKNSDVQNGSTTKLLPYADDQSNSQVSFRFNMLSFFFTLLLYRLYSVLFSCNAIILLNCNEADQDEQ